MVYLLLGFLALFYLLMALRLFTVWLAILRRDTSVSPSELPGALMILVLITIFWPLVVPFAYLELLKDQQTVESFGMPSDQIPREEEESTKSR